MCFDFYRYNLHLNNFHITLYCEQIGFGLKAINDVYIIIYER